MHLKHGAWIVRKVSPAFTACDLGSPGTKTRSGFLRGSHTLTRARAPKQSEPPPKRRPTLAKYVSADTPNLRTVFQTKTMCLCVHGSCLDFPAPGRGRSASVGRRLRTDYTSQSFRLWAPSLRLSENNPAAHSKRTMVAVYTASCAKSVRSARLSYFQVGKIFGFGPCTLLESRARGPRPRPKQSESLLKRGGWLQA